MDARVLIFWETDFPFVDTVEIDSQRIVESLPPVDSVRAVGIDELKKRLKRDSVDLFINPYGSAFPKEAWAEIYEFLAAGGHLLNLGGAPFSIPVRREGNEFHQEIRQTSYHRQLMINQAFEVDTSDIRRFETITNEPLLSGLIEEFDCARVLELQVKFTSQDDIPADFGTTGAREAILRPLLYAMDPKAEPPRRVAAPIIAIDRVFGPFAGGRWVLLNYDLKDFPRKEIIERLATFALLGPTDFQVRPSFACYYPDERASLSIHANRFGDQSTKEELSLFLKIRKDNITVTSRNIEIKDFASPYHQVIPLEIPLSPGIYTVEAVLSTGDPKMTDKYASYYTAGFWCYDGAMVSMTQPLSAGKDYFMREDKASPLIGTTYMASDVHRKFLFQPNAAVWDQDFAEMRAAGVNVVRTGIWTGFRQVMQNPGASDEGVMRAITAFMLTAAKYDMPVIFTFFAFTPDTWEGVNPYLDPRCIQAQKEYVAAIASRLSKFNNLMWDLINEPSFLSHGRIWACRPNHDPYEEEAWGEWIKARHKPGSDLSEAWRTMPGDDSLPALCDFDDRQIYQGMTPMKALDYRLFAQDVFNRWVREMSAIIRQNGNPKQLITVGQDEGGTGERPNPQFHSKDVDFTCQHTWWLNNDLLWDGVVSKVQGKPNLIEETGIMFVEQPDRMPRRTEEDCRNLLERKFGMAFASGGAGVIEWVWNTNVYMTSDNEVAIGLHRADHTQKPEFDVFPQMSAFIREVKPYLKDRQPEEVCMVIPYSGMFSARDLATEATRTCVRVMSYHCGVPMRAVGEYCLENLGNAQLILLPSPRVLSDQAWQTLLKAVEGGATLLVTGPMECDEYRRPVDRLSQFDATTETRPVTRAEEAIIFGSEYCLAFNGEKITRVDKALIGGQSGMVKVANHGNGKLVYAPLPFELSDNVEPTAALYQFALRQAGIEPPFTVEKPSPGILVRPQYFKEAILYSVVSEMDADREFDLIDTLTTRIVKVKSPAQRAIMFLLSRTGGRVLAEYGGVIEKDNPVPA